MGGPSSWEPHSHRSGSPSCEQRRRQRVPPRQRLRDARGGRHEWWWWRRRFIDHRGLHGHPEPAPWGPNEPRRRTRPARRGGASPGPVHVDGPGSPRTSARTIDSVLPAPAASASLTARRRLGLDQRATLVRVGGRQLRLRVSLGQVPPAPARSLGIASVAKRSRIASASRSLPGCVITNSCIPLSSIRPIHVSKASIDR